MNKAFSVYLPKWDYNFRLLCQLKSQRWERERANRTIFFTFSSSLNALLWTHLRVKQWYMTVDENSKLEKREIERERKKWFFAPFDILFFLWDSIFALKQIFELYVESVTRLYVNFFFRCWNKFRNLAPTIYNINHHRFLDIYKILKNQTHSSPYNGSPL